MICADSPTPLGVGAYVRNITERSHGTPETMAAKMKAAGLSWACLQASWQTDDGKTHRESNESHLAPYAAALQAAGVEVWLWGYPHADRVEEFVADIVEDAVRVGAVGVLVDPEKPFKDRPDAAEALAHAVARKAWLDHGLGHGVTSYGMTRWHPTMPWAIMGGLGFGSPQLYTVSDRFVSKGIDDWKAAGWARIVPSVAAYGPFSKDRLGKRLEVFAPLCSAMVIWSWELMDKNEQKTVRRFAERWVRGGGS